MPILFFAAQRIKQLVGIQPKRVNFSLNGAHYLLLNLKQIKIQKYLEMICTFAWNEDLNLLIKLYNHQFILHQL